MLKWHENNEKFSFLSSLSYLLASFDFILLILTTINCIVLFNEWMEWMESIEIFCRNCKTRPYILTKYAMMNKVKNFGTSKDVLNAAKDNDVRVKKGTKTIKPIFHSTDFKHFHLK